MSGEFDTAVWVQVVQHEEGSGDVVWAPDPDDTPRRWKLEAAKGLLLHKLLNRKPKE